MSTGSIIKEQPEPVPSPQPDKSYLRSQTTKIRRKLTTKAGWFGDYNYGWLCAPTLPFSIGKGEKGRRMPPFYPLDSELPILLALTCGLQHALAMLAGLITPPIIFASALNLDAETSSYMISASLIGCGEPFRRFCSEKVLDLDLYI